jgi:hypothetical protein
MRSIGVPKLSYRALVAQREKRFVSLPHDLAAAIDRAAETEGTSFSAWLADTATHRLRLQARRTGVAEWEAEHGPLTAEELAEGLSRARALLGPQPTRQRSRRSA